MVILAIEGFYVGKDEMLHLHFITGAIKIEYARLNLEQLKKEIIITVKSFYQEHKGINPDVLVYSFTLNKLEIAVPISIFGLKNYQHILHQQEIRRRQEFLNKSVKEERLKKAMMKKNCK